MTDYEEPWTINENGEIKNNCGTFVFLVRRKNFHGERVVACVNALAGENPEKVKLWKEMENSVRFIIHIDADHALEDESQIDRVSAQESIAKVLKQLDALEGK